MIKVIFDIPEGIINNRYGVSYRPIQTKPNRTFAPIGSLTYEHGKGGFRLSGSYATVNDEVVGMVRSTKRETSGVRLFDNSIVLVTNELEPSGLSPVFYYAKNKIWFTVGDLTIFGNLGRRAKLLLGLKVVSLTNKRGEGQHQQAFLYSYFGKDRHFDNRISLDSFSKAKSLLIGPLVGVEGVMFSTKRLTFSGSLVQAFLYGRAKYSGIWIDVDDIWIVSGPRGGSFEDIEQSAYYYGAFPLIEKSREIVVPVTDLKFISEYAITKTLSIKLNIFATVLMNTPLAPRWSVPGDWESFEGTGWRTDTAQTMILSGIATSLAVKF